MADLIGGHVQFMIDSAPAELAQTRATTVHLIATSLQEALHDQGLQSKANQMGLILEERPGPKALDTFIAEKMKKWSAVVGSSGMSTN